MRQLKFVSPDVAVVDIDTEVRGFGKMPHGLSVPAEGVLRTRLQQVLVKRGGQWWIEAYHNIAIASQPAHDP